MTLSLRHREGVRTAIRRIVRKRIGYAVELISAGPDRDSGERVHEARKQLKQARALLRLIRPEAGRKRTSRVDRRLRQVTRALSGIRDATVLLETLLEMQRPADLPPTSLARLRSTLEVRQKRTYAYNLAPLRHRERLSGVLRKAHRQVMGWSSSVHKGWPGIGPGLREVYGSARAAATAAARVGISDDKTLHEARKRAQDLLHVLEFLRRIRPRDMEGQIRFVHQLTDLLGKDHDLAVLQVTVRGPLRRQLTSPELRRLLTAVAKHRRSLQRRSFALCRGVYASSEAAFVKKIHDYWRRWRAK
jgi:CHAD domain-containing protein